MLTAHSFLSFNFVAISDTSLVTHAFLLRGHLLPLGQLLKREEKIEGEKVLLKDYSFCQQSVRELL